MTLKTNFQYLVSSSVIEALFGLVDTDKKIGFDYYTFIGENRYLLKSGQY